jgi:nucleotide-binding universal stress UspA family protein
MNNQILVPLDGSTLAEVVLPHAIQVARATQLSLVLLRAVPSPIMVDSAAWSLPPSFIDAERWDFAAASAGKNLEGVAARIRALGLEVEIVVVRGEPARAIVTHAEQHPSVKLVAMSTHGRSGLGRWFYGSVAEGVLHSCPVPLLLVRATEYQEVPSDEQGQLTVADYSTILVPLDGSLFAEQALDRARQLASVTGAGIVLVTAIPDEPTFVVLSETHPNAGNPATALQEPTHYLDRISDRLKLEGFTVKTRLQGGAPDNVILQTSEEEGVDLVVMATHGRGGLEKLWLGSVALKVVQGSSKPVLLVRTKERVKAPEPVRIPKRRAVSMATNCFG